MNRSRPMIWVLLGWVVFGSLIAMPVASGTVLDPAGGLGRWLDTTLAAELGEELAQHPYFGDGVIGVAVVDDGGSAWAGTALAAAVRTRVRQRLQEVRGLRLARAMPERRCAISPAPDFLVAIELDSEPSGSARLGIGVIDLEDSVWVTGVRREWRGRLNRDELLALGVPSRRVPDGSAERPWAGGDVRSVAIDLRDQALCALPAAPGGSSWLEWSATDESVQAQVSALGAALRSELGTTPLAVTAQQREGAEWWLSLESGELPGIREYRVYFVERGSSRRQLVATSHQVRVGSGPVAAATSRSVDAGASVGVREPAGVAAPPDPLLGALAGSSTRRDGICRRPQHRDARCARITLDVERASWVFLLSTVNGDARAFTCDVASARSEPGAREFRVPVHAHAHHATQRPDLGLYAIATRDVVVAGALADLLGRHSRGCDSPLAAGWLEDLAHLLSGYGDRLDWRALHFAHAGDRLIRI